MLVSGMMTYYNWYDYRFIAITIFLVSIALTRGRVSRIMLYCNWYT